jgi:hypothetical protein
LAKSLAEHAEITGTHGLEMGLHSMRQAALLGEMPIANRVGICPRQFSRRR